MAKQKNPALDSLLFDHMSGQPLTPAKWSSSVDSFVRDFGVRAGRNASTKTFATAFTTRAASGLSSEFEAYAAGEWTRPKELRHVPAGQNSMVILYSCNARDSSNHARAVNSDSTGSP